MKIKNNLVIIIFCQINPFQTRINGSTESSKIYFPCVLSGVTLESTSEDDKELSSSLESSRRGDDFLVGAEAFVKVERMLDILNFNDQPILSQLSYVSVT